MRKVLALTWIEHRRTTGLSNALNVELASLKTRLPGALRYLILSVRTVALLLQRRPAILLVQNPSLVLSALTVVMRPLFGYRLIVDAHNEAVTPFVNKQRWVRGLSRWVIRSAELTIVSNRQLAQIVEAQSGRPFTLPDPPAVPRQSAVRRLAGPCNVVLIATFAPDEPMGEVFAAVSGMDIELYVTGNHRKLQPSLLAEVPPNVHFCGFLAEDEYWGLLQSADAVVDLTLMDNCLVCGAYEALALDKPMLLSNNRATVELFGNSALFTDNTPSDIRRSLEQLKIESKGLQSLVALKRREFVEAWALKAQSLAELLQRWLTQTGSEKPP